MKFLIISLSIVAVALCASDNEWENFKSEYGKTYETPQIESMRRGIFFRNKRKIDEHNVAYKNGAKSYKLGINGHADLELHEIPKNTFVGDDNINVPFFGSLGQKPIQFEATGAKLPPFVDWRQKGVVTPIVQQGQCLACYAVAAAEAIESQYAIQTGKLMTLSAQQIVDCGRPEGNLACRGGMVDWAYKYIIRAGGIERSSDYPYQAREDVCKFKKSDVAISITNYGEVKNGSEISLQEVVAFYGPVSVSIDSSMFEWNYYTTGVFNSEYCTNEVDHAVLVVGYGTENGKDYWLVKNSYGEKYGDHGYIKMARNKNNLCWIASFANFPIIGEWKPFSPPK